MMDNGSQNVEKLGGDALDLIALFFGQVVVAGVLPCNAIEVRLDDPVEHLLDGGEGLCAHGGGGGRHYLKHYGDPEWAIVRRYDREWNPYKVQMPEMAARAADRLIAEEEAEPRQKGQDDGRAEDDSRG